MSAVWQGCKTEKFNPAIMESLSCTSIDNIVVYSNRDTNVVRENSPHELNRKSRARKPKSFLLIDGQENLEVASAEEFITKLNIQDKNDKTKVVAIFGNTGDGKSHTLNHTFFNGQEVFKTSNEQNSCTLGVWASYDPEHKIICLDTEGILDLVYEKERVRLLLKVLAITDIVIYRTRSERLNRDLFMFLGTASRTYSYHFQVALESIGRREGLSSSLSALGPSVIILHETRHTKPLTNSNTETAEAILKARFTQMGLDIDAFSSLKYVGFQTTEPPTNYEPLRIAVKNELDSRSLRSARNPHIVYSMLKLLNDKLLADMDSILSIQFPDKYFSCPIKCLSCGRRCINTMGHINDGKPHSSLSRCRYQNQYENLKYLCKRCYSNGNEVEVTTRELTETDNSWYGFAKNAWSGYVIDCPHCGEIYRSRQYWYGNKNPEDDAVRSEITHVWNMPNVSVPSQNTAQRVIDSVSYITEAVSSVSLQPTKALSAWVADQVAPSYWRPNNEIKDCHQCKTPFGQTDTKHHCRDCGEGFCAQCSSQTKCVPFRNWHTPVRVCDSCHSKDEESKEEPPESSDDVSVRKVTEQVVSTLSAVGSVLSYSKSFIKDTVRPLYWVPDSEIVKCCICERKFSDVLPLHHCRDCGRGVCHGCSINRKPVPYRGWDKPVRVCDSCIKID